MSVSALDLRNTKQRGDALKGQPPKHDSKKNHRPMTDSPEDEGLHMVHRDEPKPEDNVPPRPQTKPTIEVPEQDSPEPFGFLTAGRITFVVIVLLFIAFVIWSGYLIRQLHREASFTETLTSSAVATESPTPEVWIGADNLHITSIALGDSPLAVVNGQRVAKGDLLEVKTPAGTASLRVVNIEDGIVHFKYGSQNIDARLTVASGTPQKPQY